MIHLLSRRGPDSLNEVQRTISIADSPSSSYDKQRTIYLYFVATVLSLRGDTLTLQPLVDELSGSILCWNGEAWKIGGKPVTGNDAQAVFHLIIEASKSSAKNVSRHEASKLSLLAISSTLSTISGPFSLFFYDAAFGRVVYGRDMLGRRSLLVKKGSVDDWAIASIHDGCSSRDWEEVEADGIYSLDVRNTSSVTDGELQRTKTSISFIPWVHSFRDKRPQHEIGKFLPPLDRTMPDGELSRIETHSEIVVELENKLQQSVSLRVGDVPQPPSNHEMPIRIGILFSGGLDCTLIARILHNTLPKDSSIDLLNVAFENPRITSAARSNTLSRDQSSTEDLIYSKCPDRITGISSYQELLHICPERSWRFISINVPYSETIEHRAQILTLMYPHNTEMDLSIAYALYFAARGRGLAQCPDSADLTFYESPARVLLSGLGADELFAGYTRHAAAFRRYGFPGLLDELNLDFNRLGKRNLGRDDRIISHWGKEVRYPYLDEDFVSWTLGLPVWMKCHFAQNIPVQVEDVSNAVLLDPGKYILRLLAQKLGMRRAAAEKKRAIQFGARTARMTGGKTKGTETVII